MPEYGQKLQNEQDLLAEIQRLRMENAYIKKLEYARQGNREITRELQADVITELRSYYKLSDLLRLVGMPRSSYYYYLKKKQKPDKYEKIKKEILVVYQENRGRYGYRRITMELHNRGYHINHKTVQRLMKELQIKCMVRVKKYDSYKGGVEEVAPNMLMRDFKADAPNQKWVTDITEFSVFGTKLYLSPILDLYNGEIISYSISEHPTLTQVMDMLEKAFAKISDNTNLILHSDQGWQYRSKKYRERLKEKGIRQSMSCKGKYLDNAVMENFFGLLKSELLYIKEFRSLEEFKAELQDYIEYYNHKRIKSRLKGLSPIQYRICS